MKVFASVNDPEIVDILRRGGVGVLRTDTLYGLVACAENKLAVERIYELKGRNQTKSPIVLIASPDQLFDQPDEQSLKFSATVWPGPVSIIFPSAAGPIWLRRGNDSIAYRVPAKDDLRNMLVATGPLIAPSANTEGDAPAMNLAQAQDYFGDNVDFYVDEGEVETNSPSQLILVKPEGAIVRLR